MKKFLKIAGIVIVIVIVLMAALFGYGIYSLKSSDDQLQPFATKAAHAVFSFDCTQMQPLIDPDPTISDDFLKSCELLSDRFAKELGPVKSIDKPQLQQINSGASSNSGFSKIAVYLVHAQFENKDGELTLILNLKHQPPTILGYHLRYSLEASSDNASDADTVSQGKAASDI